MLINRSSMSEPTDNRQITIYGWLTISKWMFQKRNWVHWHHGYKSRFKSNNLNNLLIHNNNHLIKLYNLNSLQVLHTQLGQVWIQHFICIWVDIICNFKVTWKSKFIINKDLRMGSTLTELMEMCLQSDLFNSLRCIYL